MALYVLVTGATGRFGAVAELLLARGHRIRALTRTPYSPRARMLEGLGAHIVTGDYDDPHSLAAAARGVDVVLASGTAHKTGPRGEARHGRILVDALGYAGAPHLVYISGSGADRPTSVPVLESKRRVEERIRAAGLPHTILAPVYLMENALNRWNLRALHRGKLVLALPSDRVLQQIATDDVIAFAALAVERAADLLDERIELAGDELTGPDAAAAMSRASGRDIAYEQIDPAELGRVSPGLPLLFEWLEHVGTEVDIATLHARYPDLDWHGFEAWATARDWSWLGEPCPEPATAV
jgi:uncharacterized protein YbjT (DUF2867 family)